MNIKDTLLLYKFFLIKIAVSTLVILALATSAGLSGVDDWSKLENTQKIIIICGIIGVAGTNFISLLDKSFASYEQNDSNSPSPTNAGSNQLPPVSPAQSTNPTINPTLNKL